MKHAAIPTIYKGVQMRSRLEARWAAFFNLCFEWNWSYEPFDLEGWIPDFIIDWNLTGKKALVEVKPLMEHQVPRYLSDEILNALGPEPVAGLPFNICILGIDPSVTFGLDADGNWFYNLFRNPSDEMPEVEYQRRINAHWIAAGNAVQWNAPRRRSR